jgi:hypothetical protein
MEQIKKQVLEYLGRSAVFFMIYYIAKKTIQVNLQNNWLYYLGIILIFVWIFLPFFKEE